MPMKIVLLDGLAKMKVTTDFATYEKFMNDLSFSVREAALQQFLAVRAKLKEPDQVARFQLAFASHPYQVREEAMSAFANLPMTERKTLSRAIKGDLCKKEVNGEVQGVCERMLTSSGGGK
jgi:hypothetical protein